MAKGHTTLILNHRTHTHTHTHILMHNIIAQGLMIVVMATPQTRAHGTKSTKDQASRYDNLNQ